MRSHLHLKVTSFRGPDMQHEKIKLWAHGRRELVHYAHKNKVIGACMFISFCSCYLLEGLPSRGSSFLFWVCVLSCISIWITWVLVCRREVYSSFTPSIKNTSHPLLYPQLFGKTKVTIDELVDYVTLKSGKQETEGKKKIAWGIWIKYLIII